MGAAFIPTLPSWAGPPPPYHYGECWWREFENDPQTSLLLHFGPPQVTGNVQLREAAKDERLLDAEDLEERGKLDDLMVDPRQPQKAVDERRAPAGSVPDYSEARLLVKLGPGASIMPEGRFGDGLALDGSGRVEIQGIKGPGPVECWFRVDKLPGKTACLFSVAGDEARLLLHPDGRLELKLKKPHGTPAAKTAAERAAIEMRDATILTDQPISVSEWHHVVVFNQEHVVQGAGSPFDATIKLDGANAANYLSEVSNGYQFLGRGTTALMLGDSFAGGEPFAGQLDEVRVSNRTREWYERPPLPWRDRTLARPLQFDKPFFRRDGTVFHASLDHGVKYDRGSAGQRDIDPQLAAGSPDQLQVEGIRGQGWVVDPVVGFPRFSLRGMNAREGSIEFWLRPVNWDDVTGYWHHSPPVQKDLTVLRLIGRDPADGSEKVFLSASLPRAHNLERGRFPIDPGHWLHGVAVWTPDGHARLIVNGRPAGVARLADADVLGAIEPAWAEFGIADKVIVARKEAPLIEIDEVVGYRYPLGEDEIEQAQQRWMGPLEPIKHYDATFVFKWSLQKLEFTLTPKFEPDVTPALLTVSLCDRDQGGKVVLGPIKVSAPGGDDAVQAFHAVLNDGPTLPEGRYQFRFTVTDPQGKTLAEDARDWDYQEEPWRHCRAGILDRVPPPWTPMQVSDDTIRTRMTVWNLGPDGLPVQVQADGVDLLAGPFQLLEDSRPMSAGKAARTETRETDARWETTFTGKTCDVQMKCRAEYDGMIRYELSLKPKGRVGRLAFVIPLEAERARRFLYYPMGARGVSCGVVRDTDGPVLESRCDPAPPELWQQYQKERRANPKLGWEEFYAPQRAALKRYHFYGHLDLNDMNRGLWWFCDNAAGWSQSTETSAIEVRRAGNRVELVLNLVAEPTEYRPSRPIVFALLPHPARPLPEKYRLYQRVSAEQDPRACDIFDAFRPWPLDPRAGASSAPSSMKLYPAPDPKKPDAGPSWEYAESCIPFMKANKPVGLRTMYLSKAWFSCRAGAYDHWEWRSGESGAVSLTPSFVNYLCWEMDEWIRRGIWEAVYLDECYELPTSNVEAGQAVELPDGTVQPGVTNFQFRELMKRWRGIFHAHGKEPMLLAHLTYSYQYPGVLYCDAYLDGENRPIVSLNSRDWIDSTSLAAFEVVQNGRLWGVTPFYMPFIAEGGFENKLKSQFPRWQWRMARQAQSMFAHYETATVYDGQGARVYHTYWDDLYRWGAGPLSTTFHPYWDNARYLQADGQGKSVLVSFYRQPGKILLIASNRSAAPHDLRVKLNLKELGLPPAPRVTSWDGTYEPPQADDYLPPDQLTKVAEEARTDSLDTRDMDDLDKLVDEEILDDTKKPDTSPRFEGDTLILPTRAKDYRVVALE